MKHHVHEKRNPIQRLGMLLCCGYENKRRSSDGSSGVIIMRCISCGLSYGIGRCLVALTDSAAFLLQNILISIQRARQGSRGINTSAVVCCVLNRVFFFLLCSF